MKRKNMLIIGLTLCSILFISGIIAFYRNIQEESDSEDSVISENDSSDTEDSEASYNASEISTAKNHDDINDYSWEESEIERISLNGNSISTESENVEVEGSSITITSSGTYEFSGTLENGQIVVNTDDEEIVRLVLNNVEITCSDSAPIYIESAEKVMIVLADGSSNVLTDGESYEFASEEEDEPNAALFSKSDLTIYGEGSLIVNGNHNDGISSKDGLIITSGYITVNAIDDGIRGKDYLIVKDGDIEVYASGDGFKSDNEEDSDKGFIKVENGNIFIVADGDGMTAITSIVVEDGQFDITSGGGSDYSVTTTSDSAKAIKSDYNLTINGGKFIINSSDDAIHTNDTIVINNGEFTISSGDDGIHADTSIEINGGTIKITKSYESIESATITINDGDIDVVASDDGINVAGGTDSSAMGGRPGQNDFNMGTSSNQYLYINGGYIVVDAIGDGIDVNGSIEMTGGTLLVNGPTSNANGPLDYDGTFNISGGFLVAVGSSGMAMSPSSSSTQYFALINLTSAESAGSLIHIEDESGKTIFTFKPERSYQSIVFSSSDLEGNTTYNLYLGGSVDGSEEGGVYNDESYSNGSLYTEFTISSIVTTVGSSGGMGGMGGGNMRF